jgi:hypothetical protein
MTSSSVRPLAIFTTPPQAGRDDPLPRVADPACRNPGRRTHDVITSSIDWHRLEDAAVAGSSRTRTDHGRLHPPAGGLMAMPVIHELHAAHDSGSS